MWSHRLASGSKCGGDDDDDDVRGGCVDVRCGLDRGLADRGGIQMLLQRSGARFGGAN